jgi:hypothetical protein
MLEREIEGILVREKDQPYIKTDGGKLTLLYNLLDGLAGKKVRIKIEEVVE